MSNTRPNIPPIEYQWKPGQSGNPHGRPKGSGRPIVCGIYRLKFSDGCTYIGASVDVRRRFDSHKSLAKIGKTSKLLAEHFEVDANPRLEIVVECDKRDLGINEKKMIEELSPDLNKYKTLHNINTVRIL